MVVEFQKIRFIKPFDNLIGRCQQEDPALYNNVSFSASESACVIKLQLFWKVYFRNVL